MARHYSTRSFFRQMPNALLARYFQTHGLFAELDFAGMKEGAPDALFEAWRDLPNTQCNPMEVELQIFAHEHPEDVSGVIHRVFRGCRKIHNKPCQKICNEDKE